MTIFDWNKDKNQWLKYERGVVFEEVLYTIETGRLLDVVRHPNVERYAEQYIFYVEIRSYVYAVPFVEVENKVFLKTIFPDRKATKKYLGNILEE